ncbi:MAG: glycosyltransferase family 2 protein [Bacteroidetes bacterium]|nr:glycosyltransferase family 2 protein [Bacteroidota bacterium]
MIYIIIPVFNRKALTRGCLKSIEGQTFKDFKTIVVDDGSTDGTFQMIQDEFPNVEVLKGNGDLWWTGSTNLGVNYLTNAGRVKSDDFVLTLNNDLEIDDDFLGKISYYAGVYPKAILGSVSVDINRSDWMDFCGVRWNQITSKYTLKAKEYGNSYAQLLNEKRFEDSDLLLGRGTLIPAKVFDEIGFYDFENFPHYAADEDFTLRAKRNGWQLLIPTDVLVRSYISETGTDVETVSLTGKYFKDLFFSRRSPVNIVTRYRWAMKNTNLKFIYFVIEYSRIVTSVLWKIVKRDTSPTYEKK